MKVKAPFHVTRETICARPGETVFGIHAWIHRNDFTDDYDTEKLYERGHAGVMVFTNRNAVYHGWGGFRQRAPRRIVPWKK